MTTPGRPESSGSFAEARGHHNHDGGQIQLSFRNRWGWLVADARNLVNREQPLLTKEHGAVVSELNFIRQLLLIAPTIVKGPGPGLAQQDGQSNSNYHGGSGRRSETTAWENMGLLDEIIGGGGSEKSNRITEQRQPQQQTYPNNPRSGFGGDYIVLPPPYSGTPGSKETSLPPTLGPSPMSLSMLSNVSRPPTNASSTTLWDMGAGFQELPASESQTVSANVHTRPDALHKSLSSTMVFDTVGVGLLYGDGHGHIKSSSLTSTSTPRSELPGPLAAATSNTLIYNQHTHHHNYQCYHHRHNHNQMVIVTQQRQQSQLPQQHHHGGGHMICNCAWEKSDSNVRVVTAINEGEPHELSSVAFAPDPVELP